MNAQDDGTRRNGGFMTPAAAPGYLSMQGVAEFVSVPLETVRGWRKRGILPPACKLGKHVRWPRETIERWARERQERRPGRRFPAIQCDRQALQGAGRQ